MKRLYTPKIVIAIVPEGMAPVTGEIKKSVLILILLSMLITIKCNTQFKELEL